jgi:hypothetical protein
MLVPFPLGIPDVDARSTHGQISLCVATETRGQAFLAGLCDEAGSDSRGDGPGCEVQAPGLYPCCGSAAYWRYGVLEKSYPYCKRLNGKVERKVGNILKPLAADHDLQ